MNDTPHARLIPAQVYAVNLAGCGAQIALDLGVLGNCRHGEVYAEAVVEQIGQARKALDLIEAAVAAHQAKEA